MLAVSSAVLGDPGVMRLDVQGREALKGESPECRRDVVLDDAVVPLQRLA